MDAKQGKIWSLNDGKLIATLPTEKPIEQIATARFYAAGTQLLTGSTSQLATLWEVTSGRQLKQWKISTRENTYAVRSCIVSRLTQMKNTLLPIALLAMWKSGLLINESTRDRTRRAYYTART